MADLPESLDLRRRARRRLIGAIALVLALVIVPPWLMDLEPKQAPTRLSVEIPSKDAGKLKPPLKPAAVEPPARPQDPPKLAPPAAGAAAPAPAQTPPPTASQTPPPASRSLDSRTVAALGAPKTAEPPVAAAAKAAEPAPAPAAPKAVEVPKTTPEPARAETAAPGAGGAFVVPLGAFGNAENVRQLQARLTKEGIRSYTEPLQTASGEQTRVRAGPYASRDAAEKARERLKGMGIEAGNVVARP